VYDFDNISPFAANVPLTPRLVADFAAGFLYVNIHSTGYDQGEIRGQLIAGVAAAAGETIPTVSEWAMILMMLGLIAVAACRMR
jgi:hypothetical protein